MKENFNSKEYRDNLAKDLKDIRKDDPGKAQKILAEAQETNEYKFSKQENLKERNLKNFPREIRKAGKVDLPYFSLNQGLYGLAIGYRMINVPFINAENKVVDRTDEYIDLLKKKKNIFPKGKNEFPKIDEIFDVSEENPETIEKINSAIDRLNQVLKNRESKTFIKDLGESLNELGRFFAFVGTDTNWQTGRYEESTSPWLAVKDELEIKKKKYFENIAKETLEKVVNIIQHAIRLEGAIVHTDSSIKEKVVKKFEENKEDLEKIGMLEANSYFSTNSGWLEELMENGQVARITNMQIAPGGPNGEGYFATQYDLKKDGTCTVGYEATDGQEIVPDYYDHFKEKMITKTDNTQSGKMFQRFTGHTEPFEVKLDEVIKMLDNDKKIAQELIAEAEKTVDEDGEITSYKDFISRINEEYRINEDERSMIQESFENMDRERDEFNTQFLEYKKDANPSKDNP